jgi:Transcription factor WhiB
MPRPDSRSRESWIGQAACKSAPIKLFFPEDSKTFTNEVVKLCENCPVLEPCQEWAVYHEPYGYQGGMTPQQRNRVRSLLRISVWEPQLNLMGRVRTS